MSHNIKLKPYKKNLDYSYAIGVYPTLELLKYQPSNVLKVLLSSKSSDNTGVAKIKDYCNQHHIHTEIADGFIDKMTRKQNSYAVGIFRKYTTQVLAGENHLVLVGIRDMGNLGTISRTMLGFNITNLVIIKPAADIFDPKSIRASMGAVFQLNFQYFDDFESYQRTFSHKKYAFLTDGVVELKDAVFEKPYALIFGSEASGLTKNFRNTSTTVRITQDRKIDSLNLSVAVGIALYNAQ